MKRLIAFGVLTLTAALVTSLWAARTGQTRRAVAFWAAWLVPGLGHLVLGQMRKAVYFFAVGAFLYLAGLWICGWRTVSFDDNPFYWVGQFGSGVTMLFGHLLGAEKSFPRPDLPMAWYDPGLLYVCVAGLLNLVMMLSVFVGFATPPAPASAAPSAPVAPGTEARP
jgi:hypothetical protein